MSRLPYRRRYQNGHRLTVSPWTSPSLLHPQSFTLSCHRATLIAAVKHLYVVQRQEKYRQIDSIFILFFGGFFSTSRTSLYCHPILQGSVCCMNKDLWSLCARNMWSGPPTASSDRLIVMLSHTWLHHWAAQTHHQRQKKKKRKKKKRERKKKDGKQLETSL